METENLRLLVESAQSITLQILFIYLLDILDDFVVTMVWYIIVMIFAFKLFQLFAAHLTAKQMGDHLGFYWPYSKEERDRMYEVFMRGLREERQEENRQEKERQRNG